MAPLDGWLTCIPFAGASMRYRAKPIARQVPSAYCFPVSVFHWDDHGTSCDHWQVKCQTVYLDRLTPAQPPWYRPVCWWLMFGSSLCCDVVDPHHESKACDCIHPYPLKCGHKMTLSGLKHVCITKVWYILAECFSKALRFRYDTCLHHYCRAGTQWRSPISC